MLRKILLLSSIFSISILVQPPKIITLIQAPQQTQQQRLLSFLKEHVNKQQVKYQLPPAVDLTPLHNILNGTNNVEDNKVAGAGNKVDGKDNSINGDINQIIGILNTIQGNQNKLSGEKNSVWGGSNKVVGEKNNIVGNGNRGLGENNSLIGSTNYVIGGGNQALGNTNNLVGEGNYAWGMNNVIQGTKSTVTGANNMIVGNSAIVKGTLNSNSGNDNIIYGKGNEVIGKNNQIGTGITQPLTKKDFEYPSSSTSQKITSLKLNQPIVPKIPLLNSNYQPVNIKTPQISVSIPKQDNIIVSNSKNEISISNINPNVKYYEVMPPADKYQDGIKYIIASSPSVIIQKPAGPIVRPSPPPTPPPVISKKNNYVQLSDGTLALVVSQSSQSTLPPIPSLPKPSQNIYQIITPSTPQKQTPLPTPPSFLPPSYHITTTTYSPKNIVLQPSQTLSKTVSPSQTNLILNTPQQLANIGFV